MRSRPRSNTSRIRQTNSQVKPDKLSLNSECPIHAGISTTPEARFRIMKKEPSSSLNQSHRKSQTSYCSITDMERKLYFIPNAELSKTSSAQLTYKPRQLFHPYGACSSPNTGIDYIKEQPMVWTIHLPFIQPGQKPCKSGMQIFPPSTSKLPDVLLLDASYLSPSRL